MNSTVFEKPDRLFVSPAVIVPLIVVFRDSGRMTDAGDIGGRLGEERRRPDQMPYHAVDFNPRAFACEDFRFDFLERSVYIPR